MIIVFEGGDQAGKKTQSILLEKKLKSAKIKTKLFSFSWDSNEITPLRCILQNLYDQEVDRQQQVSMPGGNQDLPSLDPSAMISIRKIETLGMTV